MISVSGVSSVSSVFSLLHGWNALKRTDWRLLFLIAAITHLVGCGFALKGAAPPLPFQTLSLQAASASDLAAGVTTALLAQGVQIEPQHHAHLPRLALQNEHYDKTVLSTTTTGRVREYQLTQSVTVQLFDALGQVWLEPMTLTQSRSFIYNDNQVLAKSLEEQHVSQDMQQALISAVLGRLQASRNVPLPVPFASP
jgi:LPS-assembly lipoprotein